MKRLLLSVSTILCLSLPTDPALGQSGNPEWLAGPWTKRVSLTLAAPPESSLDDVVLLVSGANVSAAFGVANANGSDLRVTRADGTTILPHHLVRFDPAGEEVQLWFEAPTLGPTDTRFYLYYGNEDAQSTSSPSQTWESFDAVYLFEATPGGALPDESGHGNNATPGPGAWNASHRVDGIVGSAWRYGGGRTMGVWNRRITAGSEWTVSAWARVTTRSTDFLLQGNPCFFSLHVQASNSSWDTGQYKNDYCPSLGWSVRTSRNIDLATWRQHTWTTDATDSTITYWLDGELVPYNTQTDRNFPNVSETPNVKWRCHPIGSTQEGVGIGSVMYANNQDDMDGDVDVFTIRSRKIAAQQLALEHANQSDPGTFWTTGSPESKPTVSTSAKSLGALKHEFQPNRKKQ